MFYNLKINFNLFVGLGYDCQKYFSFLLQFYFYTLFDTTRLEGVGVRKKTFPSVIVSSFPLEIL